MLLGFEARPTSRLLTECQEPPHLVAKSREQPVASRRQPVLFIRAFRRLHWVLPLSVRQASLFHRTTLCLSGPRREANVESGYRSHERRVHNKPFRFGI